MVAFIEEHRMEDGVEPICEVLPIAPATYYAHRARAREPSRRPEREQRDEALRAQIRRVWKRTSKSTGRRKSGGSSDEKAWTWRAAPWSG